MISLPDPLLKHLRHSTLLKMVLASFLVYWICMLPSLFGSGTSSQASVRVFLLPAMATMYWVATSMTGEMGRMLDVFGQLLAPHPFRRRLLAEKLWVIIIAWAFLATGVALQLAMPESHAAVLSGPALISLIACLAMLRALSGTGLVAVPLADVLSALPVVLCVAVLGLDMHRLLDWFGALPFAVHAACTLTFPLLALALHRRWGSALPEYRWRERKPAAGRWLAVQARRITILTWKKPLIGEPEKSSGLWLVLNQVIIVSLPLIFMVNRPVWENGSLNTDRLLMSLMMVVMVAGALVVHDLHWRSLLRPGGLKRGRIASWIWAATVIVQLCVFTVYAIALAAVARLGLGTPPEVILALVARNWTMLLELPFITAFAVLVRASPLAGKWTVIVFAGLLMAVMMMMLSLSPKQTMLHVPLAWYAGASICLSAALVMLANRVWTIKRLFNEVARSQTN